VGKYECKRLDEGVSSQDGLEETSLGCTMMPPGCHTLAVHRHVQTA